MKKRPLSALIPILVLLTGLIVPSNAPALVCRVSGAPMEPASAASGPSCCVVEADRDHGIVLAHPGCCELRPALERTTSIAVAPVAVDLDCAVLVAGSTSIARGPDTEIAAPSPVVGSVAPRAPPDTSTRPRAPPFVS